MALGDRLRAARELVGLDQAEVARQLGIAASAVSQWEAGKTTPAKKHFPWLARLYKVEQAYLLDDGAAGGAPPPEVSAPIPIDFPAERGMPRDVPIYGVAAANETDGSFNIEATIVDYGRRPPALTAARDVYGLFVASDSMEPVYRRGDLVYVRRRLPPRPGDDVIIQIAAVIDGDQPAAFIKRLVRRHADRVVVEQFNPPRELEFAADVVIALHRVLTLGEVLGT